MSDDQLDERLREAARSYNAPPETPREEMWARIQAGRPAAGQRGGGAAGQRATRILPFRRRWAPWAAAAAAILAAGIGIGRISVGPQSSAWEGPSANATTYRLAAQEHLGQSEAFLTLFRTSLEDRTDHRLASASARQLLATNRLLLEDLELVLAEIAQLSPRSREQDLQLIRDGMERGNVMPRLRSAVPAGAAPTQGVL